MTAKRLTDRTAVIVGGAGGIGRAAAGLFVENGAAVFLLDRDAGAGRAAEAELAGLGRVGFAECDAADENSVEAAFARADAFCGGRLDILYHVAGISGRRFGDGPIHECTAAGWDVVMSANLRSVFLSNRAAVRRMLTQPRDSAGLAGTVLNLASVLAFSPAPRHFATHAYAAAKAGIIGLSKSLAAHYAPHGIRVNVLAPALIETPMSVRACSDPAIRAYLAAKQPLAGGPGSPADCAAAALYLCEPASRLVTGTVLTVDGGWCVSEGR